MARRANFTMSQHVAQFHVGQLVRHLKNTYRGVIFDVDPVFSATDDWYETVALSRPPRDKPWYHLLVDGQDHTTYVAERHLAAAADESPISHPLVDELFFEFRDGHYVRRLTQN